MTKGQAVGGPRRTETLLPDASDRTFQSDPPVTKEAGEYTESTLPHRTKMPEVTEMLETVEQPHHWDTVDNKRTTEDPTLAFQASIPVRTANAISTASSQRSRRQSPRGQTETPSSFLLRQTRPQIGPPQDIKGEVPRQCKPA